LTHHRSSALFAACLLVSLTAAGANAGVRVEDDEVVFTLRAPGASRVFLVGDFNNWNPTLERLDKTGDTFVIRLYLLPGTYRYKYVVDGEWMTDPENPAADAKRGSPLVLEERTGMLALGSEEQTDQPGAPALEPSFRYTGAFFVDDSETNSDQTLDIYVAYPGKTLRANVDFKTSDEAVDLSPLQADIRFEQGFVELHLGNAKLRAFENDTIWTSSDPYLALGNVGIFAYNGGYERKGFTFEAPLVLNTRLRAMYSDKLELRGGPVVLPATAFGDFANSNAADTVVYHFDRSRGDEDTWAFELLADLGSVDFGYISRRNRGLHPGTLAEVKRGSGDFGLSVFATTEDWQADVLWLRGGVFRGVVIGAGYGYADARVRQTSRSLSTVTLLADAVIGSDAQGVDANVPLQSSKRWHGSMELERGKLKLGALYEWSEFEFDPAVNKTGSKALINRFAVDVSYSLKRWSVGGGARYIDQDYGGAPIGFHFSTPARNFWLDWGDGLDASGMVAFDLPRATVLTLAPGWNMEAYGAHDSIRPVLPMALGVTANLVASDFLRRTELISLRADGEIGLGKKLYLDFAARVAHYNKPSWAIKDTYFASYLEVGYRNNRTEIGLGVGFDPFVLDPVANTYRNNGWEQKLRGAIPARLTRDQSQTLGDGLRLSEQLLEDSHALKLEVVLYF